MIRLARVALARLYQRLGATGMVGLALFTVAFFVGALAWRADHTPGAMPASAVASGAAELAPADQAARVPLPPASDVPLLLARMQRAAVEQGLGWPAADYRLHPATDDTPATLDVRCALVGPYPGIRRFVAALLRDNPTLTLREFSLSRASAEAAEVEAKLGIVVYLASGPARPAATGRSAP